MDSEAGHSIAAAAGTALSEAGIVYDVVPTGSYAIECRTASDAGVLESASVIVSAHHAVQERHRGLKEIGDAKPCTFSRKLTRF